MRWDSKMQSNLQLPWPGDRAGKSHLECHSWRARCGETRRTRQRQFRRRAFGTTDKRSESMAGGGIYVRRERTRFRIRIGATLGGTIARLSWEGRGNGEMTRRIIDGKAKPDESIYLLGSGGSSCGRTSESRCRRRQSNTRVQPANSLPTHRLKRQ